MDQDKERKLKEIREAVDAGNLTLQYLYQAQGNLNSASGFGIADLLGFDLIGGIGKHVKLSQAREQMAMAQQQVQAFQRELQDVRQLLDFHVDIGDFLTFADFFFDGLIADFWVQAKIGEAKTQVNNGIYQVQSIVEDLKRMEEELL